MSKKSATQVTPCTCRKLLLSGEAIMSININWTPIVGTAGLMDTIRLFINDIVNENMPKGYFNNLCIEHFLVDASSGPCVEILDISDPDPFYYEISREFEFGKELSRESKFLSADNLDIYLGERCSGPKTACRLYHSSLESCLRIKDRLEKDKSSGDNLPLSSLRTISSALGTSFLGQKLGFPPVSFSQTFPFFTKIASQSLIETAEPPPNVPKEDNIFDLQAEIFFSYDAATKITLSAEPKIDVEAFGISSLISLPMTTTLEKIKVQFVLLLSVLKKAGRAGCYDIFISIKDGGSCPLECALEMNTNIGDPKQRSLRDTRKVQKFVNELVCSSLRENILFPGYLRLETREGQ